MNKDQIIQMARDVWGDLNIACMNIDYIERFAAAIRAAIKEEDAKICEDAVEPEWPNDDMSVQARNLASSIRASK